VRGEKFRAWASPAHDRQLMTTAQATAFWMKRNMVIAPCSTARFADSINSYSMPGTIQRLHTDHAKTQMDKIEVNWVLGVFA
jgi:3-polyprenyl-4-hydroxybenzoate decarboxylase